MPTFQSVSQPLPFNLKYNDDHKKKLPRRVKDSTSMTSMISASFYLTVRLRDAFIVYNGNIPRIILFVLYLYIDHVFHYCVGSNLNDEVSPFNANLNRTLKLKKNVKKNVKS